MSHGGGDPVEVVFVGQLPPPVHGQALTNLAMVNGRYRNIRVTAVPMRFSHDIASVGRFQVTKLLRVPGLLWAVLAQWRKGRRDVLVYTVGANNVVGVARDLLVLPLIRPLFQRTVFFVHTSGIRRIYERPGLSLLARIGYGRADVVIHTDALVAGPDDQLPAPKKLAFLPHGVSEQALAEALDDPERSREARATPVILFVGNLYPSKGTHHLVRAAAHLAARGNRFEIRFVGGAPTPTTNGELMALAADCGVADRIRIVGPLDRADVWKQLADADVFCFPTHYPAEAWPTVIVEAMAASLPVVSTRWRAVPAIVDDGVTGFLVEPDDDIALADRLEALVLDPELAHDFGRAGRARFDASYTLARFEAGFERIVLDAVGPRAEGGERPGDAARSNRSSRLPSGTPHEEPSLIVTDRGRSENVADIGVDDGRPVPEAVEPVEVVFVGQLPPPVHGQSLTNLAMVSGHYERIRITAVRMRFSDDIESVGRFRIAKLLRVPGLILGVARQWRAGQRDVLLYTVGAKNLVGVARDLLVLPLIRPLFRRTVFSVRTGGIRLLYDKPGLSVLARLAYGRADVVVHADELVAGPDDQLPSPKAIAFLSQGMPDPGPIVERAPGSGSGSRQRARDPLRREPVPEQGDASPGARQRDPGAPGSGVRDPLRGRGADRGDDRRVGASRARARRSGPRPDDGSDDRRRGMGATRRR